MKYKDLLSLFEKRMLLESVDMNELIVFDTIKLLNENRLLFCRDYWFSNFEDVQLFNYFNIETEIDDISYKIFQYLYKLDSLNIYNVNLKPSNILFNKEKQIRMCDMLVKDLQKESEIKDMLFDSPELLENKECNILSDIWSFGCVLYYLINKKILFNEVKDKNELIEKQKLLFKNKENEDNEEEEEESNVNRCKYKLIIKEMLKTNQAERIHINSLKDFFEKRDDKKELNRLECNLILNNPDVMYYVKYDLPMRIEILNYMLNNECINNNIYFYIFYINILK